MRKLFLSLLILSSSFYAYSQCIEGKITDLSGNPISYATIYATDISKGTTSNIEGNYKLDLPEGKHKLTARYLGYKTKDIEVNCTESTQKLDIILEEQLYKIPEVRILASGEDPAYSIMRKAIAMSTYYQNQVEDYNCRIYLKGTGKATEIPKLLKNTFKKEGIEVGKPIIIENITDVHFHLPDVIEQNTISMRSTMDMSDMSPLDYITISLYSDIDGIISPLSKNAFSYYKFELVSSFYDQDYLVHKIKVIPRREGYDLYSGYISIVEGFWHLYNAELTITQKMFKIKMNQVYTPVENDVWMPVSHNFDIEAGIMGIEFTFKYVASVSDYQVKLNSKLDHSMYKRMLIDSKEYVDEVSQIEQQQSEIQKLIQKDNLTKRESKKLKKLVQEDVKKSIPKNKELELTDNNQLNDSAALRSVSYWDSIRPIPLTFEEFESYKIKDSIQLKTETDTCFKDSIKNENSIFSWSNVLLGGTFQFNDNHAFRYGGIIDVSHLNYNTVDGIKYGMDFNYSYQNKIGKYLSVWQNTNYAFARERMTSYFSMYYRYNGLKRASIGLSGGRRTSDFDSETGITENLNLLTTLFLKENYLKLYQKDFISMGHTIDITNGLNINAGFEYAQRKQLVNHSNYNFYNPFDKNFTSNIPRVDAFDAQLVKDHDASVFNLEVEFTPQYYYRIKENVKWMSNSKYPTFSLKYKKGVKNLFQSDVDFDQLEFSVHQGTHVKRIGGLNYSLTAGSFLNNKRVYFADYKHFGTNTPFIIGTQEGNLFRLTDYYDYSTDKSYVEIHVSVDNDRIILKRLPLLNKTLMREKVYFNYLLSSGNKSYYEVGYGLNQIFLLFNAEIFVGFKGSTYEYIGIKIGIPFVGRNPDTITIGG